VNAPRTLIPPLVRVRLPSTLATREIRATTVEAALESLAARHPQLRPTLWSGPRSLNPNVMVFHNETLVRDELLDTVLGERDMIDVVPAVESG
jgi:molybdopterin converting factor small subunit